MRDREALIATVAARQSGAFTIRQAMDAGFPESTVRSRAKAGLWLPDRPGVLLMPGSAATAQQDAIAAWLACGQPSALSSRTAADFWGLPVVAPETPELVVPWNRNPRTPRSRIMRTRRWDQLRFARLAGVTVTSLPHTVVGCAATLDTETLELTLDAAHRRQPHLITQLQAVLSEAHGQLGSAALSRLVAQRDPARPIESKGETLLFRVLRVGGIPLPVPQFWIQTRNGRRRVDFAYIEQRLALEFDGYQSHGGRAAFEDDRARDNELADAGWDRRRLTWTMVRERPADVIWTVGTALGLQPVRWRRPGEAGRGRRSRTG